MEFFGTKFTITLGCWRLRLVLAVEEAEDEMRAAAPRPPHHYSTKPVGRAAFSNLNFPPSME